MPDCLRFANHFLWHLEKTALYRPSMLIGMIIAACFLFTGFCAFMYLKKGAL
jgi:hypothetical protein